MSQSEWSRRRGAAVSLLSTGHNDEHYLETWRNAPPTFQRGQAVDKSFNNDTKRQTIGTDSSGKLFVAASDLLLRYQFYPPTVMQHIADFSLKNRPMEEGDRLVIRVHVIRLFALNIVDAVAMNIVSEVVYEPRLTKIAYMTTAVHTEVGEWQAVLEWLADNRVVLTASALRTLPWWVKRKPRNKLSQLRTEDHRFIGARKLLAESPQFSCKLA